MPGYTASVAAATALIGVDLFSGEVWSRAPQNRVITNIGVTGSAAITDFEGDLMVDEIRIGNYFNTTAGVSQPKFDDKIPLENLQVPGGAQLRFVVRDAATTSPVNIALVLEDA